MIPQVKFSVVLIIIIAVIFLLQSIVIANCKHFAMLITVILRR